MPLGRVRAEISIPNSNSKIMNRVNIFDRTYTGDLWVVMQHHGEDGFLDVDFLTNEIDAETIATELRKKDYGDNFWMKRVNVRQVKDVAEFIKTAIEESSDI